MPWIANWIASEAALQTNEIPFVLAKPAIGVWGYCPQGLAGVFSGGRVGEPRYDRDRYVCRSDKAL
jgi:hypothetical protein